ncbi:MAG: hypothetical protein JST82_03565 [Bacteroidetes bacterium]|nr:hypothetical protein [Bacteroidota bacterium]
MKRFLSITVLFLSFTARAQYQYTSNFHIGLCYPISTHGLYARDYSNNFSTHALVGVSANENAFCASGISNIVYGNAKGLIASGVSNHIGGSVRGVAAGGFMNIIRLQTRGMQAAGFMNISGSVRGAQLAGFANITHGSINGLQGAGFINITTGQIRGTQLAGYINIAHNIRGLQLGGYFNKADTVNTQISGFINVAKVAKVQMSGFMNIADSCDYPIGLINIIKKGEKAIGLSIDANKTVMASFRSGGRVLYGIVGLGYNYKDPNIDLYAFEAGLGAHFYISKNVRLNVEATSTSFTDITDDIFLTSTIRALPTVFIGKHIELFAGPAINSVQTEYATGETISGHYLWSDRSWGYFNGIYISGYAGLQYKF